MKKVLFVLAVLSMMFVTSCTNDDIIIERKGKIQEIKLKVNLSHLYDTFNQTKNVQEKYLRDRSGAIGVAAYLYDHNGNAVDSTLVTSFTTNTLDVTFKGVESGEYKIVAIETLVNPDDKNQSDSWRIVESSKISSLAISQIDQYATPYDAFGVVTTSVTVDNNDVSLNVTPSVIGSQISFYSYNIENLDVVKIGYGTNDMISSYKLDPNMKDKERYNVDLSDKDHFCLRGYLSKESFLDNYHLISYVVEDEIDWTPCLQDQEKAGTLTWSVFSKDNFQLGNGKTYYAALYYMDKIDSYRFDIFESHEEMEKFIENCEKDNVGTSIPQTSYVSPYIDWRNGTVNAVKKYMTDYELLSDITKDDEDGSYTLTYMDMKTQAIYIYTFSNSTFGLTDCYIAVDASICSVEDVKKNLVNKENYTYLGNEDGEDYYTSETTGVIVAESDGFVLINYYDLSVYYARRRAARYVNPTEIVSKVCAPKYTLRPKFISIPDVRNISAEVPSSKIMMK